jgi:hypothetical protein
LKEERSMEEIWKPVPGYEGKYEVSNMGRVWSLARITSLGKRGGLFCRFVDNGKGYKAVGLHKEGENRKFYIHRIVVEAHFGPIPEGMEVNHKDGDKSNNRLDNLELLSHSQNLKHAFDTGLHPGHEPENKRTVAAYCSCSGDRLAEFSSIMEASLFAKTKACGISNALAGRQETAGGFIWRYCE